MSETHSHAEEIAEALVEVLWLNDTKRERSFGVFTNETPAVDVGALDSLHFDAANNRTRYDALGKDNGTQVILYAPVNKQLDVDPSSMRCLSFCPICDANGNCDELVDDLDTTGYQEAGLLRLLGNAVRRVRSTGRALGVFQVDDEIFLTPQRGRAR